MFRRLLPLIVFSGAVEGAPAPDAAPAPAAVDTGLAEQPGVLATLAAGSVAGADTAAGAESVPGAEGADSLKGAEDAPAELKPEDYVLTLPDGVPNDDPLLQAFLKGAAKGGMDNESVNAVIGELGPMVAEMQAAPLKAWQDMNAAWAQEVKTDPVIGGANLDKTIATIGAAARLVCSAEELPQVVQALEMTGAGNNVHVVRMLQRMASRLVEGAHVAGGVSEQKTLTAAERMYPTHNGAAGANT